MRPGREKEAIGLRFLSAGNGRRLSPICLTAVPPNNLPPAKLLGLLNVAQMLFAVHFYSRGIHAHLTIFAYPQGGVEGSPGSNVPDLRLPSLVQATYIFTFQGQGDHMKAKCLRKLATLSVVLGVAAMSGGLSAQDRRTDDSRRRTPIKHVVVIFQENISFDHYFGCRIARTDPQVRS